jgi:hypothetical protein
VDERRLREYKLRQNLYNFRDLCFRCNFYFSLDFGLLEVGRNINTMVRFDQALVKINHSFSIP